MFLVKYSYKKRVGKNSKGKVTIQNERCKDFLKS